MIFKNQKLILLVQKFLLQVQDKMHVKDNQKKNKQEEDSSKEFKILVIIKFNLS